MPKVQLFNKNKKSTVDVSSVLAPRSNHNLPIKKRITNKWKQQAITEELKMIVDLITPEEYSCDHCEQQFSDYGQYKSHLRRHITKISGKHTCQVCNKSFVQQSSLQTHERIHTGERPYKCEVCDKAYGDLSTYTKHQRTHTGVKPYPCKICTRRFSQSGNCLRHRRSVHSDLLSFVDKIKLANARVKQLKARM